MSDIAKRIVAVRGALTQGEFASRLQINPNTLRAYEKGRAQPGFAVLTALCAEFSVSPAWILTGHGEAFGERSEEVGSPSSPASSCGASPSHICPHCLRMEKELVAEREERAMLSRTLLDSMRKIVELVEEVGELRLKNVKLTQVLEKDKGHMR